MTRWILKEVDEDRARQLVVEYGIPFLAAEIILRRNIKDIERFLYPDASLVKDPFLITDMEKAVDILINLWKKKVPILIHGDYDVDGITGAAILYLFLKKHKWNVEVFIPDRMSDGYGVNSQAIVDFAKKNGGAILTVDCGITAFDSIELAKKLGLKVIVTDHHEPLDSLPPADAIVNPHRMDDKYPFKELAGVGVAYKLIQALADRIDAKKEELESYLDLVALGTVADMVPLIGENRYYVKKGIKLINKKRYGLKRLIERLSLSDVTSKDISYKIAPKLNAAGRMGSAHDAFRLIVAENEQEAEEMVSILFNHNALRQEIESGIYTEAVELIEKNRLDNLPLILVGEDNWHLGVIGIVASRLANKFKKPALVVSFENGIGKGSARSFNNINILEIFHSLKDYFLEFGGHSMAVGFTLRKEDYKKLLEKLSGIELQKKEEKIEIDAMIEPKNVNPELFEIINLFEPYGLGNPPLRFLLKDLDIIRVSFFDGGDSANLILKKEKSKLNAVWLGMGQDNSLMLRQSAVKLDIVGEIEPDFTNPKIKIKDVSFKSGIEEIDSIIGITIESKIDKEEIMIKKTINSILWEQYNDGAIFSNIRTRNAIIRKVMKDLENAVVVSCCSQILDNIYRSLKRHEDFDEKRFLTIEKFLQHPPKDKFVILVEPATLLILIKDFEEISEFLKLIKTYPKIAVGTKMPDEIKEILKAMRFKRLRAKFSKTGINLQDLRGRKYRIQNKNFSIISQSPEKFVHYTDGNYYSDSLNRFQRASMVNLIKRGNIKKIALTPSTDGLPTLIKNSDVVVLSYPNSIYELLDAVYPVFSDHKVTLVLNYQNKNGNKYKSEIDKAYSHYTGKILTSDARHILKILRNPKVIV